jgi:polyketide synthase 12
MSGSSEQVVEALRTSLKETERLRLENEQLRATAREPLAIVGIGCRYPGAVKNAGDLWDLVAEGRDAIGEFPTDRGWDLDALYDPDPDHSGTSYVREGGFLYDAGDFDAGFFQSSPREALGMDPQHRLLLEVSWEAVEDAGIDPVSLRGSRTGVFVGAMHHDYGGDPKALPPSLEGYLGAGSAGSVASGMVAHSFGFEGPAVSIDTACSSSLVAMHLACQALRQGECSLALAAGVSVMATPGVFVLFSRQRGLAPDGRCKPYADAADGTGTSEGVGVVLLERLSDAVRLGHVVLGVVRGSAVNQDGASNGLTAPSGPSQQRVVRQALGNAGLSAAQVDVVEGHGTGTRLGDPIEAQALLATYGQSRRDGRPLWLGSVKSNIGHAQAAAGVAGVIKMVMALRRGVLPRTLHVDRPSGEVDWSAGAVSLLVEEVAWEGGGEPRRAGVSSFGASGTNAHVILEEAPPPDTHTPGATLDATATAGASVTASTNGTHKHGEPQAFEMSDAEDARAVPWVLSARGEGALAGQAQRLLEHVSAQSQPAVADVGLSLLSRSVFEDRAVVVAADRAGLLEGLDALARTRSAPSVVRGKAEGAAGGVVFVFPGQGSQWEGMAVELLDGSPVFARYLWACGEALAPHVDWSLEDVLRGAPGAPSLERVDVVQPALFAVMVSLAELWRACGVHPAAVVGHSQGEIAAAHVAGALSLEDAARVVAVRSRALGEIAGQGGMMSVALGVPDLLERLRRREGEPIVVAAVNGPASVVVSGEPQALEELHAQCKDEGVRARIIPVSYAAHSPQVEGIREALLEGCSGIEPRGGDVPFYSAVTGGLLDPTCLDAEYWYRNLRETVQFDGVTRAALQDGRRTFVEVSPHPVLTVGVEETAEQLLADEPAPGDSPSGTDLSDAGQSAGSPVEVVCSLRRDQGGPARFVTSLAEAWVKGASVHWESVYEGLDARRVALPTYAFQRERYWHEPISANADIASAGLGTAGHPLLGATLSPADGDGLVFTGRLSLQTHPWLSDHAVMGMALLPGSAFAELALHAGAQCGCESVSELTLQAPLVLDERDALQMQVVVGEPDELGARSVGIYSRSDSEAARESSQQGWTLNASGALVSRGELSLEAPGELVGETWPPKGVEQMEILGAYGRLAECGLDYGPAFQGLQAAWRRGPEVFAEVSLPEDQRSQASLFGVHPALLDAALHGFAASLIEADALDGQEAGVRLPFSLNGVSLDVTGSSSLRVRVSPVADDVVSLVAVDETGSVVLAVRSLTMRPVSKGQLGAAGRRTRDSLFRLDWVVTPTPAELSSRGWAAVGPRAGEIARALAGERPSSIEVHADLETLGDAIGDGAPAPELVLVGFPPHALPADDEEAGSESEGTVEAAHAVAHEVLALVQSWLADERFSASRLVLITQGAVAARIGEHVDLATTPLWGLVRSAQAEDPGRFVLVDMDGEQASWEALASALATDEPQLAIREEVVLAARLARVGSGSVLTPPAGVSHWRLETGGGTLEGLRLAAAEETGAPLKPGEVRVAVRAAGLNFRDVVTALGLVSHRKGEDLIGSEGAGVVLEVGPAVTGIEPGDRVMGLLFGAFGTVVVADHRMIAPMPEGWSFIRAASLSGAFLTAYYGLVDLAGLKRGERLLVHAAAGGVGMAAVQLARHLGAEVWGTASPGKWDALRGLGLEQDHIASSRDLDFKERFLQAGGGVDVVLNSLAREYVDASCELLVDGGRFIEMGKTDIRDPEQVATTYPGVSYRAFDLLEAGPERIRQMLLEIVELFERGVLEPLPVRAWDVRHAPEAFRFMSQARHVGKIVLTLPTTSIEPHGTALITGGTGELGALVARHLVVEHGMRSLVIAGRRGLAAPGAQALEAELTALGAEVTIAACDVSEREQLAALIEAIPPERPLSVVVHSAGVLDDGVITALTAERIDRVLAPKVDAAWHLHQLTKDLDLQAFILFSSASGIFGRPGQANYAAANVFLDALAAHRRARNLPAVSMAWGGWAQASEMTGRLTKTDVMRVQRAGIEAFSSEEGLELFDAAYGAGEALVAPVGLDLAAMRAQAKLGVLPALLRDLVRLPSRQRGRTGSGLLRGRLADVPSEERRRAALDFVCAEVATVLGHSSSEAIDVDRAFKELGFDSLLAVELRNRLSTASGLRLPSTLVFDYPTPLAIADYVLGELDGAKPESSRASSTRGPIDEPLAIVGMSCRYPGGVRSPQELWDLVASGSDAIGAFPIDRGWDLDALFDSDPDSAGTSYGREGGFVHDVGEFDAAFFGISPREAIAMDPQQRLLLEGSWEAFEDAGLDPSCLRGSQTGVFVGVGPSSYGSWTSASSEGMEGFRLTGTFGSVASGRVAYTFGLEGPAVSIDTACSSSLVAMHLACDALRSGECSLALAGGVSVMATPDPFVEFSRQRGLARDGRCKSFSDAADGAGWGEGVGMLLLERLSDAHRAGHRVLALVRGSAINQDGASNGLTAPNGPAQQRVIRRALANAGLSTVDVDAVEAHGTGTVLGDPIEAQALLATYGQDRDRPLWLGSIKSNVGHAQHAAGAAGVIKMVMALRHELLPRTLHVDEPSQEVDWSAGAVSLLVREAPWRRNGRPRRAGVSSFGVSGTNAHLILEEPPAYEVEPPVQGGKPPVQGSVETEPPSTASSEDMVPWVLSGHGQDAVRAMAARLRDFVAADNELAASDVALSLAARARLEHRAVVLGGTRDELLEGSAAVSMGEAVPNVVQGVAGGTGGRVAFLFTGQGAQRAGMGRELYDASPVFKDALDRLCAELDAQLGCSLLEVMFAEAGSPKAAFLDETMFTQAALFALEVSLFRTLEGWGVRPDCLLGHSIGELSAAFVAGVFSVADACKLVVARGRLMGALPPGGAMIAVQASEQEALESLAGREERVALAAVNGPAAVVLSGELDTLSELAETWRGLGRKVKRLQVSHAFHSPRMDPMLEGFAEVARTVAFHAPRIQILSNLSGEPVTAEEICSPDYWVRHVRETVRFADGVDWLAGQGVGSFLELGPDGVLGAMVDECLRGTDVRGEGAPTIASALKAGSPERRSLLSALAELWTVGAEVDWTALTSEAGAKRVGLPTYPFQRRRYWLEGSSYSPRASHESGRMNGGGGGEAGERGFWDAVEREDLEGLLDTLGSEEGQRSALGDLLPGLSAWRRRSREHSKLNGWRYRVGWKPISPPSTSVLSGRWLVLLPGSAGEDPWIASLIGALEERGAQVVSMELDSAASERQELAGHLRATIDDVPGAATVAGVVSLLALDERPQHSAGGVPAGLAATVALAQALEDVECPAPLWLLTRGAVSVASSDRVCAPIQAQTWGLGLTLALERPSRWGGMVDLPETLDERIGSLLVGALVDPSAEDQLAIRGAGVFARRLARADLQESVLGDAWTPPAGTILITGGTGGLGAHVARWLARAGARHLLLASRRGADAPGARELQAELKDSGSEVTIVACDVGDGGQLAGLLESIPEHRRLSMVVHAAGTGAQGAIGSLTAEDLEQALSAKARGALHLDALTESMDLSAFVLFSSIAGTLGSGMQAPYAAANAYLDALATQRRARGLPATSIAWGPWLGAGMAQDAAAGEALRRHGLEPMAPDSAIEALRGALLQREATVAVADVRWDVYAPAFSFARARPLIEDLPEVQAALGADRRSHDDSSARELRARLLDAAPEERRQILLKPVRAEVARVLGHPSVETVDPKRAFKELGFDSLTAVELRNRLDALTGLALPATLVFDYPTPLVLSEHLLGELVGEAIAGSASMDDELAGLERRLPSLRDGAERSGVAARLRALLGRLESDDREHSPNGKREAVAVDERMQGASDEEIFDFIDQELGSS